MMVFVGTVFASALGFLLAMGVAYAIMLQPRVLEWMMNKTMDVSMKCAERIYGNEDKDL